MGGHTVSRWADAFAALSEGADTLDTLRHLTEPPLTASQSVDCVTTVKDAATESAPVLLADGRWLWRFRAESIPEATSRASVLTGEAHCRGAVLVADGVELIVVEQSWPPLEIRGELRQRAGEIIAVLRRQSRCRDNDPVEPRHPK
jgi:hypothetical protein